jgi:predicted esterase YcpF (UPF0227 family)
MVFYLHGFRSSPLSFKARLLKNYFDSIDQADIFLCPQLPVSPKEAMKFTRTLCASIDTSELVLIGSSLGGFYATALAEELSCKAVLLNPAITPSRDLQKYIGSQTAWHTNEQIDFRPEYVNELTPFEISKISQPERYFLIAATGDEVLDWQQMVRHYPGARHKIIQGSDHGLSDFRNYMDEIIEFCTY